MPTDEPQIFRNRYFALGSLCGGLIMAACALFWWLHDPSWLLLQGVLAAMGLIDLMFGVILLSRRSP